jgi:hypothetical protein
LKALCVPQRQPATFAVFSSSIASSPMSDLATDSGLSQNRPSGIDQTDRPASYCVREIPSSQRFQQTKRTKGTNLEQFKLRVGGQPFVLTRFQLEHDAPNFFTSALLGDWSESQEELLDLPDRDPQLFRLVSQHLSGYTIFPLDAHQNTQKTLLNLKADAQFYGLDQLAIDVQNQIDPPPPPLRL